MSRRCPAIIVALMACAVAFFAAGDQASGRTNAGQDESALIGDWRGESICQDRTSPCRDEKVIYHISRSNEAGKVTITADKVVDGRAITMGSGDYVYDSVKGTLRREEPRGAVWSFTITGTAMEGTLTLPDKRLYRRVTLRKT